MDLYIKPIGIYIKYIGNGWEWPLKTVPGNGFEKI